MSDVFENKGALAATIVVAASDSLNQGQANYVCTGVNDHVEIQAALDALPATGGEVKLLDGTYNCEVAINLDSNQTLRGCGRNTILTTATAALVFLSAVGGAGTEKTGIVIADLQIDGGAGSVGGCGIYFEYVDYSFIENVYSRRHYSGALRNGICLTNSDFNTLLGNTCQGNYNGIYMRTTSNSNTISANTCQGNGNYGIWLNTASNNNTMTGNICQVNKRGITVQSSLQNTIVGNTCRDNTDYGIHLYSSTYNTITGNSCQGNTESGISLNSASNNNTMTGNICDNNGVEGIAVESSNNNTITGNMCEGNAIHGIYLNDSSHNAIAGNICQGNAWTGIFLDSSLKNTVSGNICQGNTDNGIAIMDSSINNTVSGNTCQGNLWHGIYIHNSDNNTIVGNTLTENSQGLTNNYDDIYLTGSDYNNIQGNTCRAGALAAVPRYGINISDAACDKNLVANNDLYDDGFVTAPFNDAGTLTTVKSSNRGIQITDVKDYVYIKNTSGGASAIGDVARHKAVAAGNEYDTPTANGEDSVLGMVAEVIADNASGLVQVGGKTTVLKSTNAGGNIAIGDYLCTEAGVRARLAAAGDMAFARALEACAAADCTIDALIISPMRM